MQMPHMRKQDLEEGKYILCLTPQYIYGEHTRIMQPGMVATIASLGGPRDCVVDFYNRTFDGTPKLWRSALYSREMKATPQEEAFRYLREHAPTWEEHLDTLLEFYSNPMLQAIQKWVDLKPYLTSRPSQQEFVAWLEAHPIYEKTGLPEKVTRMALTSWLSGITIPWTYR
jgi:hypothetical protein